ncbi:TatD family hydrolase [Candidatus Halobeggiatoa sp. HSG11]|nr:TatD family hydrolase [Candidatus Halobeggiatoa sp. HSG11]
MLVDSHCHLDLIKNTNPETIVAAAQANGVGHFLNVGLDLDHLPNLLAIAKRIDSVSTSVGIHPNNTDKITVDIETLVKKADNKNVVAIGETGLDYFRLSGAATQQQQQFRTHIRAAKEIDKPLIIHCREAAADTIRILKEEQATEGVMHCFVEDWDIAQQAMELGFYISFSGIVTFKNAKILQDVAKKIPLERMLVETDSPYLAPVPHRGKDNQPAYVKHVAEFIAELREEPFATIEQVTTENFSRLFKVQNLF